MGGIRKGSGYPPGGGRFGRQLPFELVEPFVIVGELTGFRTIRFDSIRRTVFVVADDRLRSDL